MFRTRDRREFLAKRFEAWEDFGIEVSQAPAWAWHPNPSSIVGRIVLQIIASCVSRMRQLTL